jgi:acetyl esterase/lipase
MRSRIWISILLAVLISLTVWTFPGCNPKSRDEVFRGYEVRTNLSYDPALGIFGLFDLYEPVDDQRLSRPCILAVHGGGWRSGNKSDWGDQPAQALCPEGYVVVSINYRLAPSSTWPAQIDDCEKALKYFQDNAAVFRIDPNRIGCIGVSAGGHLSSMLGLRDGPRVRAAVTLSGEGDLSIPNGMFDNDGILHDVLGSGPPFDPNQIRDISPVSFARPDSRILIIHSINDPNVYFVQAQHLYSALQGVGADVTFVPLNSNCHGCFDGIVPGLVRDFFRSRL